jgi:hypothetical protein
MKWGPRFSFIGIVGGILAAFGLLVLLQQGGRVYPTVTVALVMLIGGILFGIVLPSLGVLVAVRRYNRAHQASPPKAAPPPTSQPAGGPSSA